MSAMQTTVHKNPAFLTQVIWYFLVGVWLGEIWTAVAWVLMASVIGLPFGVMMLNRLPWAIALREPQGRVRFAQGAVPVKQVNLLLRGLYFILVGWWLSALWMQAAYALCATLIGLPLGFWRFDRVPALLSLHRD